MEVLFQDLTRDYVERRVLDIPQGRIQAGSRTAIVGANGAGKSTLLNIIAGLDTGHGGRVFYGNEKKPFSQVSSQITMVFQKPYLITTTVEKNIAFPMKIRGFSQEEREKRVSTLCDDLNLTDLRKQKSWKLSGGETQKVALARALGFGPGLLLLDEPTANVDPATTGEIEQMLLKINKEKNTTLLFVTHNLVQAKRVCNRIMFLHRGRIIEEGEMSQVLTQPREGLTRQFIAGELIW
jgi:tungstate transport system ATP-binding protein